jgi:hypothetical protein
MRRVMKDAANDGPVVDAGFSGLPCGRCGSSAFHAASGNQNKPFAMTASQVTQIMDKI